MVWWAAVYATLVAVCAAFLVAVAVESAAGRRAVDIRPTGADGAARINAVCLPRASDACPAYEDLEASGAVPRAAVSSIAVAPGVDAGACGALCVGVPVHNENGLTAATLAFDVPPLASAPTRFVSHLTGQVFAVPARTDAVTRVAFDAATGAVVLVP